ncbi:MAG: ATP-binding protein [Actinomycetota bacterium]
MTCSSCGAENRPGRKFCASCGAPLATACPACGAANEPADRFCGECGAVLVPEPDASTPAVAASVLTAAPSERRLVSVLFTDLVGFTPLSESRDAEEVRDLLSGYFDAARRIVERYGGTIEKFIGDAVMAMWGSPVAREDDAERAVRAGLDLVAAVTALGADEGIPELAARAGVATGEAAVNRAAEGEGMVIGDLVNTAARVQSAAPPGAVFVTEGAKRASDAAIAYDDAGTHELKGKAEPMRLHRALRVVAGRGGAIRHAGLEAPFVGRDRELRLLKDLFHATADGGVAHLVSVSGVGGIGKTRLAWEFEKYLDGLVETVYWHRGRCIPYGDGVAYWALAEMVRSRLGAAEEEEAPTTLVRLREWLDAWCAEVDERRWLESQLAQLLGFGDREAPPREELFSAWRRFFELLSDRGPVVLVFEDLQWADTGLLDFVDELLVRAEERPLYVVALARPEIAERRPGWGVGRSGWTSITLGPLRDADIDRMLRGMVPGISEDLLARIRERAEGVPLYAVETVRMLLDKGVVRRTDDGMELSPEAATIELAVPETLQALIGARLDGLPDDERSLLQHASIVGKTFGLPALAAVTGIAVDDLQPLVDHLVAKELLTVVTDATSPDRGQYGFLQSIVQRVVYDTVSRRDRKTRHLAVARHLQETWPGDEDDVAEVVAAHYVEAYESAPSDPDAAEIRAAATSALERAGRRALSIAAPVEAAGYFDRAAELAVDELDRARLAEQAVNAVWLRGDFEDTVRRALEVVAAYDALQRPLDAARVRARVAEALWLLDRLDEALAQMEGAYEALAGESGRDVAVLAAQLGRMRYFHARDHDDLLASMAPIEHALELAERDAIWGVLSDAINTKGLILGSLDRWEEGLALERAALEIALAHDETWPAIRAYTNLSNETWQRDEREQARGYQQAGLALAERTGYWAPWWFLRGHEASYLMWTGRWEELSAVVRELEGARDDPASEAGRLTIEASYLEMQAVCRGDLEIAEQVRDRFTTLAGSDDFQSRALGDVVLAQLASASGDQAQALERSERVVRSHAALGVRHWIFKLACEASLEAALALGDADRADATLAVLRAIPRGGRSPMIDAMLAGYGARIAAARGERDEGLIDAGFADAIERLREQNGPFRRARFELRYAEWLASTGRVDDARMRATAAAETFRTLEAGPWLAQAEALLPVASGT